MTTPAQPEKTDIPADVLNDIKNIEQTVITDVKDELAVVEAELEAKIADAKNLSWFSKFLQADKASIVSGMMLVISLLVSHFGLHLSATAISLLNAILATGLTYFTYQASNK